jgi:DNA primase
MRFSDDFVEQIRDRVSLASYVGRVVALRRTGNRLVGRCPFHEEKSPSFQVSEDKGVYYCFGCGAKGDLFQFAMAYHGQTFAEAVSALAAEANLALPTTNPGDEARMEQQQHKSDTMRQLLERGSQWFHQQLAESPGASARSYLTARGLSQQTIEQFELGFAPSDGNPLSHWLQKQQLDSTAAVEVGLLGKRDNRFFDWFRGRIIFPIRDDRGRLCGFGGRVLSGDQPKYLNSPESPLFQKSHILYGLHQVKQARQAGQKSAKASAKGGSANDSAKNKGAAAGSSDSSMSSAGSSQRRLILVEGYLDVIALHQASFPIAIAPLGTAITADHLRLAFGHCDHLTICLDGDAAGRRAALRTLQLAMPLITESRQLDYIRLPAGDDPDSLLQRHGQSAWQKLQESPLSLEQAIVSLNAEGLDLTKPAARARLHRLVRDILGLIPDPVLRQEYHHALAQQLADWLAPYQQTMHQLPGKSAYSGAHSGAHSGTASKNRRSYANKNAQDGLDSFGTSSLHPMPPARLQQLQVASLLRVLMDNPDLWADVAEEAMQLPLQHPVLERLRGAMAEALCAPLNAKALLIELQNRGMQDGISLLQQPAINNILAPYQRLTDSISLRQRWQADWHHLMVDIDLNSIATPSEFPDQEAWERFQKQRLAQEKRRQQIWQQDNS